jgi:hypothetical protein
MWCLPKIPHKPTSSKLYKEHPSSHHRGDTHLEKKKKKGYIYFPYLLARLVRE